MSVWAGLICEICGEKVALAPFGWYRDGRTVPEDEREDVKERTWAHHFATEHTGWRKTLTETHRARTARLSGLTYRKY